MSWNDDQAEMAWKELTSNGAMTYKDTLRLPNPDSWTSFPLQKTGDGWTPVMEQITYHRVK
ncbi:MAG TPA: hypothetical protein VLU25_07820 [Acidobacteriota bacterium]|nr:hypothetical protein [Acidobacteriota bacterium]